MLLGIDTSQVGEVPLMTHGEPSEGWLHAYESKTGFSDDAIHEWLRSNNLLLTQAHPCLTHSRHIWSTLDSFAKLHSCEAFLCRNSNHAFALKKFKGIRKLLDSLHDTPVDLRTSNISSHFAAFKLTLIVGYPGEYNLPSTSLYMEKQEKSFCLIYSFNMALGEHIISGDSVLSHIQQMEDT